MITNVKAIEQTAFGMEILHRQGQTAPLQQTLPTLYTSVQAEFQSGGSQLQEVQAKGRECSALISLPKLLQSSRQRK